MTIEVLRRMIRDRHVLLPLIYEFNRMPARYIHYSRVNRYTKMDESGFTALVQNSRAEKILSGIILEKAGLTGLYHWDFDQRHHRLALIDGAGLARLLRLAGLAVNSDQIIRVIRKKSLLDLKKSIGVTAYLFALKKAPFLIGRKTFSFVRMQRDFSVFNEYSTECGAKCLGACLSGAPRAMTLRLGLKLPAGMARFLEEPYPQAERKAAFSVLKKILIREVDPQWTKLLS